MFHTSTSERARITWTLQIGVYCSTLRTLPLRNDPLWYSCCYLFYATSPSSSHIDQCLSSHSLEPFSRWCMQSMNWLHVLWWWTDFCFVYGWIRMCSDSAVAQLLKSAQCANTDTLCALCICICFMGRMNRLQRRMKKKICACSVQYVWISISSDVCKTVHSVRSAD